jgi:hypothetical protein
MQVSLSTIGIDTILGTSVVASFASVKPKKHLNVN